MTSSADTADTADTAADRRYWIAFAAVALVLVVPLWLVTLPPLSDYYNHLARLYILDHYDDVAAYREVYAIDWGPYPNLALDVLGRPLIALFSLDVTGKLFLTITVLLWHFGCHRLGVVIHGRPTWRALPCSLFVFNQQFLHGYCNFSFGMGVFLFAFAYWLKWRRQWNPLRLTIVSALATVAFFSHLSAYATFAVATAAVLVVDLIRNRKLSAALVASAVPAIPGAAVFFYGFLTNVGADNAMLIGHLSARVRDFPVVVTGYHPLIDVASMAVIALLIAIVWVRRAELRIHRDVAVAGIALGVAYVVIPYEIASGIEVNVRFAFGCITVLAFAVDVSVTPGLRRAVLAAATALFVARTAVMTGYWVRLDDEHQQHRAAFAHIETGARVYNVYFYPMDRLLNARRVEGLALIHSLSIAAVTRHAHIPTLYGIPGQQPLAHRRAIYNEHRFVVGSAPGIQWDEVTSSYDYLWACQAPEELLAPLRDRAQLVTTAGSCGLYEL